MKPLKIMPEVWRLPSSNRRWCRLSQTINLIDEIGLTTKQSINLRPEDLIRTYGHLNPTVRRIAEIPESDTRVFYYHHNTQEQYVAADRVGVTLTIDPNDLLQIFVDADWVEALVQHLLDG